MWSMVSALIQPSPAQRFANAAGFTQWLTLLSHEAGEKEVVLIFDEGDSLANLSIELRSEFLGLLTANKFARTGRGKTSDAPVKVRP